MISRDGRISKAAVSLRCAKYYSFFLSVFFVLHIVSYTLILLLRPFKPHSRSNAVHIFHPFIVIVYYCYYYYYYCHSSSQCTQSEFSLIKKAPGEVFCRAFFLIETLIIFKRYTQKKFAYDSRGSSFPFRAQIRNTNVENVKTKQLSISNEYKKI